MLILLRSGYQVGDFSCAGNEEHTSMMIDPELNFTSQIQSDLSYTQPIVILMSMAKRQTKP